MIMSIGSGTHTYSAGMVLTYKQYKKIWNACYETGCIKETSNIWTNKETLYCYDYIDQGVKVYLSAKSGKWSRLRVQIEPCRVLGEKDPTALAHLDKNTYKKLVKTTDKLLKKLKIPCSIDKMKISRCDLTVNLEFSSQDELTEYLRIIWKSLTLAAYNRVTFKKNEEKAKDCKTANAHSYCISCGSANFLVYDKIAQLQMIGRCDETLLGKHILRFEAELKRPALKKHLGKSAMDANYKLLSSVANKSRKVISWYLNRIQPNGDILRYKDAVKLVEHAKLKAKTRERMLYLLRKTSDKDTLSAALKDLKKTCHLSSNQCRTVLKKFRQLGISPITLANSSDFKKLPDVCTVLHLC